MKNVKKNPMYSYLMVLTICSTAGLQTWRTLFNNFAVEVVGFTINHIAAVVLPAVGGLLWIIDYRIPFVGGAFLSLISLGAVQKIRIKPKGER